MNTYNEFINNIINTRGQWSEEVRNSCRGCERHHILPRCLGGKPKSLNWEHHENIIWLYPAEHFIAHKLLAEENKNNCKLLGAYLAMAFPKKKSMSRDDYKLTPEEYEEARIICSVWSSMRNISDKTRENMSNAQKGHIVSQETRNKISNKLKGRTHTTSDETKAKISKAVRGKKKSLTLEQRDQLRQRMIKLKKSQCKKVRCIELNEIFDCAADAVIKLKLNTQAQQIRKYCRGTICEAGGYSWEYVK